MEFGAMPPPSHVSMTARERAAQIEKLSDLFKAEEILEKMYAVYNRALDYHRRGVTTKCSVSDIVRLGNFISTDATFLQNDAYVEYEGSFETSTRYSFYSRDQETQVEFLRITICL